VKFKASRFLALSENTLSDKAKKPQKGDFSTLYTCQGNF
jgi:hypothetical protein